MAKYISLGKFNRKYFFILGSIIVRIILLFISGLSPYIAPNETYYLLGIKSQIFSHPLLSYCFQYFFIFLGGLILEIILQKKTRTISLHTPTNTQNISRMNSLSSPLIYNNKLNEKNEKKYFFRIFLVFSLYYYAKIAMTSLDNLGYNRIKYWPLEFIFLIIFAKKILKKTFYKHQKLSLTILLCCCTTIYVINSFIPKSNKDCTTLTGNELEECKLLNKNIYNDVKDKLGWYYIPIIILIYLGAMVSNSFSSISNKWFMDIKYIHLYRILIYLGIIGFCYSIILLLIFSNISCSKEVETIAYICKIEYDDNLFYENYRTLSSIEIGKEFFIDIFVYVPLFCISSFLDILFELIIIIKLDPFYLIPIDCTYFFIYEVIDYSITYKITNLYRDLKFVCQICSNGISVILCCIYLEIIVLHFYDLDVYIRMNIIDRVEQEKKLVIKDIKLKEEREEKEERDNELELELSINL